MGTARKKPVKRGAGQVAELTRRLQEAEETLDELVYELLNGQYFREAA